MTRSRTRARRTTTSASTVLVVALLMGSTACGSDDGSAVVDEVTTSEAFDEPTTPAASTPDEEDTFVPAPEEDTGTVTLAGATMELTTADFTICETVNPAFADDVNIVVNLPDGSGEDLLLRGTLGDMGDEFTGLFIRSEDSSSEEQATDLQVARDGRVLTGSAVFERGPVEFMFHC